MADRVSIFDELIKQSNEAYAATIDALGKVVENIGTQAAGSDRNRQVENVLRLARMSKDGVINVIERGFELWERQVRQIYLPGTGAAEAPSNPMQVWAENWRKAAAAFAGGGDASKEFRKQAEAVQKTLADGIRAWQRLGEPEKGGEPSLPSPYRFHR